MTVPEFATYFDEQWNNGDEFTNGKIFCSHPKESSHQSVGHFD
jgi:hypothetical protein